MKGLLVDTGATIHIIADESKFVRFDESFKPEKHYLELADGSRTNNIALKKGDARVTIDDSDENSREAILENALYVPSFKQDIFSVKAATENDASIRFMPDTAELVSPNGKQFPIEKHRRLYFLNTIVSSKNETHSLKEWHEILGHCDMRDVLKLENVENGMKITGKQNVECGVCVMGKMSQYRNKEPDERATSPLELVHSDLCGPIHAVAREGFRYVTLFVDDYSGIIMVYFLKKKSDTLRAMERFLADSSPYGTVNA